MIAVAVLALVASEAPRVLDVGVESQGPRQALRFTVVGGVASVAVAREGEELVLALGAALRPGLVPPEPVAPVQRIRFDVDGMATRIRITGRSPERRHRRGSSVGARSAPRSASR